MRIDQYTKIAALIKYNNQSIDAIASIAKPLEKLKNPILRSLLARRVNLLEAARLTGISITKFREVLENIGFIWASTDENVENNQLPIVEDSLPDWLVSSANIQHFDLISYLKEEIDPLPLLIKKIDLLAGDILCIESEFVPVPLIEKLKKKNTFIFTKLNENGLFHTFIKSTTEEIFTDIKGQIEFLPIDLFSEELRKVPTSQFIDLDVSGLPMPQPMALILNSLTRLKRNEYLSIKHRKIPLHLLEELANSEFTILLSKFSENDFRMMITLK